MFSFFNKKSDTAAVDVKEQVREWQRRLRSEQRQIGRDVHRIDLEETKIKLQIKNAAKRQDMRSCQILAKEVARSRRVKQRLQECSARMNSISMSLRQNLATMNVSQNLRSSTEVMQNMSQLIKAPEVSANMQQLSKEMAKMGLISDMVDEAIESIDPEGVEDEAEDAIKAVLEELAIDVTQQLPSVGSQRLTTGPQRVQRLVQKDSVAASSGVQNK